MKKGIRAHDVAAKGLSNICKKCFDEDIHYLQLVLEKSVEGFEFGKFTEEYAENLKKELDDMKIAILGSYINPSSSNPKELKKDIEKFKEKIRYASILKPYAVGTETGFYSDVMSDKLNNTQEAYTHLLKNLGELVCEAERYNVNIGIEGVHCFVINTPEKMSKLIRDLNSENAKVIFDPVNYINVGNYQNQDKIIENAFELFADKIIVIHAKDFIVENNTVKNVIPGEGLLNYKLIFKKLKEYKLDIPIISEEISDEKALKAFENLSKIQKEI